MSINIVLSVDERTQPNLQKEFWIKSCYIEAIEKAGGCPVLLPSCLANQTNLSTLLSGMHGVVITGGDFDIDPKEYGQAPNVKVRNVLIQRTEFEKHLFQRALDLQMPILGICGGAQLINVCLGGSLLAHIENHERTEHEISIEPASHLAKCFGGEKARVNSTHHQAIDRLGKGLTVSARSKDQVIEAIQGDMKKQYLVGIQWHPEMILDQDEGQFKIYQEFIQAAGQFKNG